MLIAKPLFNNNISIEYVIVAFVFDFSCKLPLN